MTFNGIFLHVLSNRLSTVRVRASHCNGCALDIIASLTESPRVLRDLKNRLRRPLESAAVDSNHSNSAQGQVLTSDPCRQQATMHHLSHCCRDLARAFCIATDRWPCIFSRQVQPEQEMSRFVESVIWSVSCRTYFQFDTFIMKQKLSLLFRHILIVLSSTTNIAVNILKIIVVLIKRMCDGSNEGNNELFVILI